MKLLTFIPLLIIAVACNTPKNTKSKTNELNGEWIPISQELGGKPLPSVVLEKEKLVIADNQYTLTAESVDKGQLSYANGKMDIYGKEGINTGKHFTAIYKYENGLLTICYNLAGDSYPDGFESKTKPTLFLSVFKKNCWRIKCCTLFSPAGCECHIGSDSIDALKFSEVYLRATAQSCCPYD